MEFTRHAEYCIVSVCVCVCVCVCVLPRVIMVCLLYRSSLISSTYVKSLVLMEIHIGISVVLHHLFTYLSLHLAFMR